MKRRRIVLAAVFISSLILVSFLPLYIERTMRELMFADGSGGAIEWGWERTSLRDYWRDYRYMQREQTPAVWLGVNLALALGYASVTTFGVGWILARKIQSSRASARR